MKVAAAVAICIILVLVNSVYSEESDNIDSSLGRETREASTVKSKNNKVTRKEKRKQRKLKKKQVKSKGKRKSKDVEKKKKKKGNGKTQKKKTKKNNKKETRTKRKNRKGKKKKTKNSKGKKKSRKNRNGKKKLYKKKKKTKGGKKKSRSQQQKINNLKKSKEDNSSLTEPTTLPKKLNCDPPNTKAVNNFKQNRRFYDKYNLLKNKLDKINVFNGYANLLGKMTNNGTTCTNAAKEGFLLLSGCETSAAAACNNTEFTSTYLTAIGCVNTINCNTTKIPAECKIQTNLSKIVAKTRECTNKNIPGTYSYCMSYIKENVSTVVSNCFDEIINDPTTVTPGPTGTTGTTAPTVSTEPTVTTEPTPTKTGTTIFVEGDEIVEQKESYNPDAKELTLSVPAHGKNVALKAIIGVDKMVTSYDNYCVLGDPPADFTPEVSERSRSTDNVDEFDSNSVQKVYSFNVVQGELTDAERAELPESFQTACKDKPIQKTTRIVVDEATFNQDSLDSVETLRKRIISRGMDSLDNADPKGRINPMDENSSDDFFFDHADLNRRGMSQEEFRFETWDLALPFTSRQANCSSQKVIKYILIDFQCSSFIINHSFSRLVVPNLILVATLIGRTHQGAL